MLKYAVRKTVATLDQLGLSFLAGIVASAAASVLSRSLVVIRRIDVGWLHHYSGTFVVLGEWSTKPQKDVELNFSIYFSEYIPKIGDTCVDVGAGSGTEVIELCRRVGPTGMVVAVEANPDVYERLLATIRLNKFTNCLALNVALAGVQGRVFMSLDSLTGTEMLGGSTTSDASKGAVPVAALTLEQLFQVAGCSRVDYLKMNIEGAEGEVISTSSRVFSSVKNWCISCHDFLPGHGTKTYDLVVKSMTETGLRPYSKPHTPGRPAVQYHVYVSADVDEKGF